MEYYKAYDARYRAIHRKNAAWAAETPTPIVLEMLETLQIPREAPILEIGCGEGRDSAAVLKAGYALLAGDVSPEAIRFCREKNPGYADCFRVMDACTDHLPERFAFIYATAVLHMLVVDGDRRAFFQFIREHLSEKGKALILTMGDGEQEFATDVTTAFDWQLRTNNAAGIPVTVPNTSCRMVSFATLREELQEFTILSSGITQSLPDFNSLMYVLIEKKQNDSMVRF